MPRALVTGGAGFIGSHLTEHLLESGYEVTVLDNLSSGFEANLETIRKSVTMLNRDATKQGEFGDLPSCDLVFHLAANASVPRSAREPEFDASANVLGTINVLEFAKATGAKVIFTSSAAVYGNPIFVPMDETHPRVPVSPYGQSKLSAEGYIELYRRLWGVKTQIIRYFNAYGERGRRFVVWDFAQRLHQREPEFTILGRGDQIRSFLHVRDAARATRMIAELDLLGPINVGGTTLMNMEELAMKLQGIFGVQKPLRYSGESWPGDIARLVPDCGQLHSLGFKEAVSIDEGLDRFATWFRSRPERLAQS